MFTALEDFLFQKRHGRNAPRQKRTFAVLFSPDRGENWLPAYGLDVSLSGMRLFSQSPIPEGEVPLRASLGRRVIDVRVRPVWHVSGTYKKGIGHEYGVQLVAADAPTRELLERWLGGKPLEEINCAQDELREIRLRPDDAARLIPAAFQQRLFRELLERGRLAAVDARHPALVAYDYAGRVRYRGTPLHLLTVHSKVVRDEGEDRYTTRILFDDGGTTLIFPDDPARRQAFAVAS